MTFSSLMHHWENVEDPIVQKKLKGKNSQNFMQDANIWYFRKSSIMCCESF